MPVQAQAGAAQPQGQGSPAVLVAQNPALGPVLTDSQGMTLYTKSDDTPGTSTCSGVCASAWPSFQPPAGNLTGSSDVTGTLGTITRGDGTQQVAYNGTPLYYFSGDKNPGDANGQGINSFGGTWLAATP